MCDIWGHTCAAFICITPFRAASRGGEVAAVCSLCWVGTEVGPSVVSLPSSLAAMFVPISVSVA